VVAAKTVTVGAALVTTVAGGHDHRRRGRLQRGGRRAQERRGRAQSSESVGGSKSVSASAISHRARADYAVEAGANVRVSADGNVQITAGVIWASRARTRE
ncbi:MAG: hypothetical protein HC927_12295, partial [Deltaproteobacteria bacterium]|nr:hypothetical protein [Deltaproteobacteria bacterium]